MTLLSRRKLFTGGLIAPLALGAALVKPARAGMGAGKFSGSALVNTAYTPGAGDQDILLMVDCAAGGSLALDDLFPLEAGFGALKHDDTSAPLFVWGELDGYTHAVFTVRGAGADFYHTPEGWKWFPYGPQKPVLVTSHRTVAAPVPGDSYAISPNSDHGETIRGDCTFGPLQFILPPLSQVGWGATGYRNVMNLFVQKVDFSWNTLTITAQNGEQINRSGQHYIMYGSGTVRIYGDGAEWWLM